MLPLLCPRKEILEDTLWHAMPNIMMIILLEVKQGKWKLTTLDQIYMDSKKV